MALTHEFGIIDDITEDIYSSYNFSYVPDKSQCITVDDAIIANLMKPLSVMKTYFLALNRPEYGLAYHGTTIIPPESFATFLDIVIYTDNLKPSEDLSELGHMIIQAKTDSRYMIHYGI